MLLQESGLLPSLINMLLINPIFSDHMVIAFGKPIRISGKANEEVSVCFKGIMKIVTPINDEWEVIFPKEECGGPYELTISVKSESHTFKDIYVGLTLLMAGQSNQQFKFREGLDEYSDYPSHDNIRLFSTNRPMFFDGDIEPFRASDGWKRLRKEDIPNWPSISYQVSRIISERNKDIRIGLVTCYEGASVIEAWIPEKLLMENNLDLPLEDKHPDHSDTFYRIWNRNGLLYDTVFSQCKPISYNAICYYQGESDTSAKEGLIYDKELALLASTFRKDTNDMSTPFIFVEIANLDVRNDEGWKGIQKAQERASMIIPNSYLIDARDVSETNTIHPKRKKLLSNRIANQIINIFNL